MNRSADISWSSRRLSKQSHKSGAYETSKSGRQGRAGPGERAALRRRSKSKPAYRAASTDPAATARLLISIDRTGSSSSSRTQSSDEPAGWPGYRPGGQAKHRRHAAAAYDCQSLPHTKHRRRGQLSSARSETCLRDACCHPQTQLQRHQHGRPLQAKSVHDLQAETSSEALRRLEYEEVALSEPSLCDAPVSDRRFAEQQKVGQRVATWCRCACSYAFD